MKFNKRIIVFLVGALLVLSVIKLAEVSATLTIQSAQNGTNNIIDLKSPSASTSGGSGVTSVTSGDSYLAFSPTTGAVIGIINSANLNATIDQRATGVSLPWSNQAVNTTSNVTFDNITANKVVANNLDIANSGGVNFINADGVITGLTSMTGFFSDTGSCLVGRYAVGVGDDGTMACTVSKYLQLNETISDLMHLNRTGTNANANLSFNQYNVSTTGGYFGSFVGTISSKILNIFATNIQTDSLNVTQGNFTNINVLQNGTSKNFSSSDTLFGNLLSNGTKKTDLDYPFNGTGVYNDINGTMTIPHQKYDITATTALDTTYTNTLDRPIRLDIYLTSYILTNSEEAYVTSPCGNLGFDYLNLASATENNAYFSTSCTILAGQSWSISTKVSGSGSVTLTGVIKTVL